jgi:hypothetical protein
LKSEKVNWAEKAELNIAARQLPAMIGIADFTETI